MTSPFGLLEFLKMPFRLHNAAQTFQCFMYQVLCGVFGVNFYIDDILIAIRNPEQHLQDLRTIFEHLYTHGVVINPNKCIFGAAELEFLGHQIDQHGISPLLHKVQVIHDFP